MAKPAKKHHAAKKAKPAKHHSAKKSAKSESKPSAPRAVQESGHLIMFHGAECFHCRNMDPLVEQLEKEYGIKITKIEVWHNEKNAQLLSETDQGMCGGVPFFWNAKTKKWMCGETGYDELKEWAGV